MFNLLYQLFYQYQSESPYEIELINDSILVFKAFSDARLEVVRVNQEVKAISLMSLGDKPKEYKKSSN